MSATPAKAQDHRLSVHGAAIVEQWQDVGPCGSGALLEKPRVVEHRRRISCGGHVPIRDIIKNPRRKIVHHGPGGQAERPGGPADQPRIVQGPPSQAYIPIDRQDSGCANVQGASPRHITPRPKERPVDCQTSTPRHGAVRGGQLQLAVSADGAGSAQCQSGTVNQDRLQAGSSPEQQTRHGGIELVNGHGVSACIGNDSRVSRPGNLGRTPIGSVVPHTAPPNPNQIGPLCCCGGKTSQNKRR